LCVVSPEVLLVHFKEATSLVRLVDIRVGVLDVIMNDISDSTSRLSILKTSSIRHIGRL
jgi:hypothetical protein